MVNVMPPHYNVLFLCTGNSARSIFGEAILNHKGRPHFTAYSAGSHPKARSGPRHCSNWSRPSSDDRLSQQELGRIRQARRAETRFCIYSCDNAANEVCPIWPGQPMTAHWGVPDPAAVRARPRDRTRIPRCVHDSRPENQFVPLPADCQP